MDNLTHTLVGAAMGHAGLKRRTALAMPALLIGANLPDLDAFVYFFGSGVEALAFRRGWTHGVLAMVVLPLLLWGVLLAVARLRRRDGPWIPPLRPAQLLLVCTVAVWSHPLLDWLNTYGVRLLMPFSGRWFYGDTLFIVDPWVLLALLAGVGWSWRCERRQSARPWRPARAALGAVVAYVALMNAGSAGARRAVAAEAPPEATRVMAGPVPLHPFRREFLYQEGDVYRHGRTGAFGAGGVSVTGTVPIRADHPESRAAAATYDGERFLVWSRYPFFDPGGGRVWIGDARYMGPRTGWASVPVDVGPAMGAPE
jgi:inner membrane protein